MMSTWGLVILKYVFSGLTISFGTAERVIRGLVIPASRWEWVIKFDSGEAMALLSLVFGLYFGGKFSPDAKSGAAGRVDLQGEGK